MSRVDSQDLLSLRTGQKFRRFERLGISNDLRRILRDSKNSDWSEGKTYARDLIIRDVLNRFGRKGHNLRMLTLPGPYWIFEKIMLRKFRQSRQITFIGVERAKQLFRLAASTMPKTNKPLKCSHNTTTGGHKISNGKNAVLIHANVHQMLLDDDLHDESFDAIWLDLSSPITEKVIQSIIRIGEGNKIRRPGYLALTLQASRESLATMRLIEQDGGRSSLLRGLMADIFGEAANETHFHRYGNNNQMIQIGFNIGVQP